MVVMELIPVAVAVEMLTAQVNQMDQGQVVMAVAAQFL